jgi:hypothetical protein
MGDLDVRLGEIKATQLRETLVQLQDTTERLRQVELNLGPAHRLLKVRAQSAANDVDEADYAIRISRVEDGGLITFDVTGEAVLLPGDVVEVRLKRAPAEFEKYLPIKAIRELDPASSFAQGNQLSR